MMRRYQTPLLSIILCVAVLVAMGLTSAPYSSPVSASATIHVPGDYPTIQAAVDAASPGDTIVVAPGTYVEQVSIPKSLTLIGADTGTSALGDDFEWGNDGDDIDTSGGNLSWTKSVAGSSTAKISTAQAYSGTRSMRLHRDGTNHVYATCTSTEVTAYSISVRVRKDDTSVVLMKHGNGTNQIFLRYDASENLQYYDTAYRSTGVKIAPDTWALLEIRNINWDDGKFDIYQDGMLAFSGADMRASSGANDILEFTNAGGTSEIWFDDVFFTYDTTEGTAPETNGDKPIIQGGVRIQADNVVLDGFEIDGPASDTEKAGIFITGGTSGHTIANNILVGHGTSSPDGGWAIKFGYHTSNISVLNNDISNWWSTYVNPTNPSANILFEGNHFHDNSVGIGSDGINDVNIRYNKFTNNILEGFGTSAVGSDVRAHYNDFVGNGAGINNYDDVGIVNATNNWWGHNSGPYNATSNPEGQGDAVSDGVLWDPPTTYNVPQVWVDDDFNSSTPGWGIDHFATIQDGVNNVDPGGTVNVAAGTYNERLVINKSLTLLGAQAGVDARGRTGAESIIDAGLASTNPSAIAVTDAQSFVTINGFKIIGSRGAVIIDATTVTFINNIVQANASTYSTNSAALVYIDGPAPVTANQVTIKYNDISPIVVQSPSTNCLRVQTGGENASVLIDNNIFRNASAAGLGFSDGNANAAITFTNNELYDNSSDGFFAYNCDFSNFTATGNRFENNSGWGINFASGVKLAGSISVNGNTIAGNTLGGLQNVNSVFTVDATNNWWGDPTGPYHPTLNDTGLGNAVSDYVDFIPYLDIAPGTPSVTALNPDSGNQGQSLSVTITGTNFTHATSVSFGEGISTSSFTINSDSQIAAGITIDAEAALGIRDVSVTSPAGTGTLADGFTVTDVPPSAPGWYEQFTSHNSYTLVFGANHIAQSFTPSVTHYFNVVALNLYKQGTPNYTVTISLHSADESGMPIGPALCSTSFAAASLTTSARWYEFNFSTGYQLLAGSQYAIVLSGNGGTAFNSVLVRIQSSGGYPGGTGGVSNDSGRTWTPYAWDIAFKEGQQGPPSVTTVIPDYGLQGQTMSVTIYGSMFSRATSVYFGEGITVNSYTVVSSTQITAVIIIDESAALGPRDVCVTTPTGTGSLPGGFTVAPTPDPAPAGWYEQFTSHNSYTLIFGANHRSQSFTPSATHYFNVVALNLYKQGTPNYTVTISLHIADENGMPIGPALCSTSFAAASLTTTPTWYEFGFATGYYVLAGRQYAIVLSGNGGTAFNSVLVRVQSSGGYPGGTGAVSTNGGTSWTAYEWDIAFREGQS